MDMIDSGRVRLNDANWRRMLNDPRLIALGQSHIEDRTNGRDIPAPARPVDPGVSPGPDNLMAQALGYGSIAPRPVRIGRQSYQDRR